VRPSNYTTPRHSCYLYDCGAKNAKGHAKVKASNQIYIKWINWPESHKGPIINILASCSSASYKTSIKEIYKFFKINKVSLIKASNPNIYGFNKLITNNNS
jgi:cellulase